MKLRRHFIISVVTFFLIIVVGAYAYSNVEGWSGLDSLYFVVVTVTTIGYGDLVPQTNLGKIFTMFFSFLGISAAFYFVSMIGASVFKEHLNERGLSLRRNGKKSRGKQ